MGICLQELICIRESFQLHYCAVLIRTLIQAPFQEIDLDLAVRPTERVKYLLCCVFNCKGAGAG